VGGSRYGNKSDTNMNLSAIVFIHEDIRWGANTPVAARSLTQNSRIPWSASVNQHINAQQRNKSGGGPSACRAAIKNFTDVRCFVAIIAL
jgi:hypothetical protein